MKVLVRSYFVKWCSKCLNIQQETSVCCLCVCDRWQTLECTERCVTVSEPVSLIIAAMKYRKFGNSSEIRQLARDIVRWECRPHPTMQPQPLGYCLKLTSVGAVGLPLFRQCHFSCYCTCADQTSLRQPGWRSPNVWESYRFKQFTLCNIA